MKDKYAIRIEYDSDGISYYTGTSSEIKKHLRYLKEKGTLTLKALYECYKWIDVFLTGDPQEQDLYYNLYKDDIIKIEIVNISFADFFSIQKNSAHTQTITICKTFEQALTVIKENEIPDTVIQPQLFNHYYINYYYIDFLTNF